MVYLKNSRVGKTSLKRGLETFFQRMPEGKGEEFLKVYRNESVRVIFKNAVDAVYKQASNLILQHINAVYVLKASDVKEARNYILKKNKTVLAIYCDDALVRSDLKERSELLQIYFNKHEEHIGCTIVYPATRGMKQRHAYELESKKSARLSEKSSTSKQEYEKCRLSDMQCEGLKHKAAPIENKKLKKSICSALEAYTAGNMVH